MENRESNHSTGEEKETMGEIGKWSQLAETLFPEITKGIEDLEITYPERNLPGNAEVTRVAPSPTGNMHIGGIFAALVSERIAHQSNGIFYLRVEDTDKKREKPGAREMIVDSLNYMKISIDEGEKEQGIEEGNYGPYTQSKRTELYQTITKDLVRRGLAYPDFTAQEKLEDISKRQKEASLRTGYYGDWAVGRSLAPEELISKFEKGFPFTIRLRSGGDHNHRIMVNDEVKGNRELPENDLDIVLLKSDGTPTYHLAHVVDDHFMRTTFVIRGEEWYNSLPLHLQLFSSLGWNPPKYGHYAPIQKMEESSRRKLSKRSDPEASLSYYKKSGFPVEAVKEYLLSLANTGFEEWRKANKETNINNYPFDIKQLGKTSGALLDLTKLESISQETISRMTPEEKYENICEWAKEFAPKLYSEIKENEEYSKNILKIEDDGSNRRKDIRKFSDSILFMSYFFDDMFIRVSPGEGEISDFEMEESKSIIKDFLEQYQAGMKKDDWLELIKSVSVKHGFARTSKEFKENPNVYKGQFADVARLFRVLIVGRNQSPDLYEIMQVMGTDRITKRLSL